MQRLVQPGEHRASDPSPRWVLGSFRVVFRVGGGLMWVVVTHQQGRPVERPTRVDEIEALGPYPTVTSTWVT